MKGQTYFSVVVFETGIRTIEDTFNKYNQAKKRLKKHAQHEEYAEVCTSFIAPDGSVNLLSTKLTTEDLQCN